MPRSRRLPLVALLVAAALLHPAGLAAGWRLAASAGTPEADPALTRDLHDAVNAARADVGLGPLHPDAGLAAAARAHAAELARRGVLDHAGDRPETRTLPDRLVGAGVPYTTVGENLAFAAGLADPVATFVEGWLGSPPHRANLLNVAFDRVGYGSARADDGGLYVVQVFAAVPWSPTAATATLVRHTVRTVVLDVEVEADAALDGLLELDGATERVRWSPGSQRLERTVRWDERGASEAVRVRLGVDVDAAAFRLEEAGAVRPDTGWVGEAGLPRHVVAVRSASATDAWVERVHVRLTLPPGVRAELLVDGVHQPAARRPDESLEAWLDVPDGGVVRLALAEPAGAARLTVRHAFAVVRRGSTATLEARR